jgi:hypothetical protein
MIRLSLKTGVERVESRRYPGVVYHLRRLRTQDMQAARQAALGALQAAREGIEALAPYGFDGEDANRVRINPRNVEQMMGVGFVVGAVEVMLLALERWEGVAGDDGEVAPLDRRHLAILLQDDVETNFLLSQVDEISRLLVTEGNGSAPSPAGSTATRRVMKEGQTTAKAAEKAGSPASRASRRAAAATARSSAKPRARKKASPSGA